MEVLLGSGLNVITKEAVFRAAEYEQWGVTVISWMLVRDPTIAISEAAMTRWAFGDWFGSFPIS